MSLEKFSGRAMEIRRAFMKMEKERYGRIWTREEVMMGLVGDIGDLAKLVLAEAGIRDIADSKKKIAHELSDCLWSVLVLAEEYGVDLEKEFFATMDGIERKIENKTNAP
jgi:NTP pyrophosphatase (non-canonical NTP hydrolase)